MKTLKQIREASGGKEAYQKFFNSILKKFGVSSPSELEGKKKKDFFDAIDKGWEGDNEKDESVKEAKLKGGRGKTEIDINWDGSAKDKKFAETKYKIKIKPHRDGAIISGDKQKILAYLQGQDYGMDDMDIEDLYPEVLETYTDPDDLDPETTHNPDETELATGKKLGEIKTGKKPNLVKVTEFSGTDDEIRRKRVYYEAKVKLNRPEKHIFDLAMKAIARSHDAAKARTKRGVEKYMDYEGMDLIDDIAGVSLTDNEKNNVYNAVRDALNAKTRESVKEVKIGKTIRGAKLGKPYPVLDAGTQRKVKAIAKKHSGNMQRALKDIEKLKKGLGDNPDVMDILRRANEDVNTEAHEIGTDKYKKYAKKITPGQNEAVEVDCRLLGFKASVRRAEGEKQKGRVIVDRRTKGAKEAKLRAEKAKARREEKRKQKEFAEKYPKIDYKYGNDAEVKEVLNGANEKIFGETAANSVSSGNVDLAPNAGKKKKDKVIKRPSY